jgi:tetratricopeptide (TPR) repeat protein
VDATPGHKPNTRWGERFDAALTDVLQVQADIATQVAGALDLALADSTRRALTARPTENLAAYDLFLQGEAASHTSEQASLRRAIRFYRQAIELDSGFVAAWAQLSLAASGLYGSSTPSPELAEQARTAAVRAQALGPTQPDGSLALGRYYAVVLGENRKSLAAYEVGLRLAPNSVELLSSAAVVEQSLGRWDAALEHFRRATALDPRSTNTARRVSQTLILLRRYPEAQAAVNIGLKVAPTNLDFVLNQAMLMLAQGDLGGARASVRAALRVVEPEALVAFFGSYEDLVWVLDSAQQELLLTLSPSAFDDDRGVWGIVRAQTHHLRGEGSKARVFADSARLAFEEQLRGAPDDAQRHVFRGLALAYLGRKAEAIREGERAVQLVPISEDAHFGPYIQHQLARICVIVGESEKALDQLEPLLRIPYSLSPGWLRIDPNFAPLRGNPRFERLIAVN